MAIVSVGGPSTGPIEVSWTDLLDKPYDEIIKPSTESVSSTTTPQNDDHLLYSVESGKYHVEAFLSVATPNATAGFRVGWTGPAANSIARHNVIGTTVNSLNSLSNVTLGAAVRFVKEEMTIDFSASGTLQLQWAQNGSDGGQTQVRAGSWMRVRRLDA
ncbi:MAG TPA: hypothetical protein PLW14_09055 [Chlorobiota bacterium]|nr:hypothetical protein [Chlorobiota bacterium]